MTSAIQAAREAVEQHTTDDDWLAVATVMGLLAGYDARWAESTQRMRLQSVESEHVAPLKNIETGRNSRTWQLGGKLDKIVDDSGAAARYDNITPDVVMIDHKTTSMDIAPDSGYWRQLAIDGQASHYELLLLASGFKLDRIVWDVVRKPGIRPKKIAKATRASVVADRTYCGRRVSSDTLE